MLTEAEKHAANTYKQALMHGYAEAQKAFLDKLSKYRSEIPAFIAAEIVLEMLEDTLDYEKKLDVESERLFEGSEAAARAAGVVQ